MVNANLHMVSEEELERLRRDAARYHALRILVNHTVNQNDHPRSWRIDFCSDESTFDAAADELVERTLIGDQAHLFRMARPRRSIYLEDFLNLWHKEQAYDELQSVVLTCKRKNTVDWMKYLVDILNKQAETLGDPDRAFYQQGEIFVHRKSSPQGSGDNGGEDRRDSGANPVRGPHGG